MTHRIDKLKELTGLSEYKIAKRSGLCKQTLNNEKHRNGGMSEKTLNKLSKGLNILLRLYCLHGYIS